MTPHQMPTRRDRWSCLENIGAKSVQRFASLCCFHWHHANRMRVGRILFVFDATALRQFGGNESVNIGAKPICFAWSHSGFSSDPTRDRGPCFRSPKRHHDLGDREGHLGMVPTNMLCLFWRAIIQNPHWFDFEPFWSQKHGSPHHPGSVVPEEKQTHQMPLP